MLKYQDHGYENLRHKIISFETLMAHLYNLMHPIQTLMIGYYPYLY